MESDGELRHQALVAYTNELLRANEKKRQQRALFSPLPALTSADETGDMESPPLRPPAVGLPTPSLDDADPIAAHSRQRRHQAATAYMLQCMNIESATDQEHLGTNLLHYHKSTTNLLHYYKSTTKSF